MRTSVIIPAYNYGRFVADAIASVQRQTVDDLEIIVIDDGSTDDTPQVLAAINDPRLRVFRTVNQGLSAARMEGLRQARGEYIAFLDADDRWRPEKLERQLAMMEADPQLGAVFTNLVQFNGDHFFPRDQFSYFRELKHISTTPAAAGGRKVVGNGFEVLVEFSEFPTWIQTILFRASTIRGIQFPQWPRDERGRSFSWGDDTYFCLRAYERAHVGYLDTPLVEIRRHGDNMTHDLSDLPHARLAVLRVLEKEPHDPGALRALRRRLGRGWVDVGRSHIAQRRLRRGVTALLTALGYPGFQHSAAKSLALLPFQGLAQWARSGRLAKAVSMYHLFELVPGIPL